MRYITAKPDHFDLLELREEERTTMAHDPLSGLHAKQLIEISLATCMTYQGKLLCIMGFYEQWPGVYNVWILPSVYAVEHPLPFLRAAKRYVKNLWRDLNCHRLQSNAISNRLHNDWMQFLGFTWEGTLVNYTSDMVNYCMWAITKE
jgi:hypothetical protein